MTSHHDESETGTRSSSLRPVGEPSQPDRLYDLKLKRLMDVANERTRAELGPLPPGGVPVPPKRKPDLPRCTPSTVSAHTTEEDTTMIWNPRASVAAAGLALAACTSTPAATPAEGATTGSASTAAAPISKNWPLRFRSHSFSARCYDTVECEVWYANLAHGDEEISPSSSSYGPDYLKNWNGSHGMIANFPEPAEVRWRSKDGVAHEARIDIGEIFQDQLIRHHLKREEIPDYVLDRDMEPSILLEVNDRTIRVYTRTYVTAKEEQIPGNRYSRHRDDLILVKTYTY